MRGSDQQGSPLLGSQRDEQLSNIDHASRHVQSSDSCDAKSPGQGMQSQFNASSSGRIQGDTRGVDSAPLLFRVLLLCSGPTTRTDSLAKLLKQKGIQATEVDIENVDMSDQNMLDDAVWQRIKDDITAGRYHFLFASPPCRTFSEARAEQPGPPVLRSRQHPYGFPKSQAKVRGLVKNDFDKLREDNLLADRTAEACHLIVDANGGYAVEQPYPYKVSICMFELSSFKLLRRAHNSVIFDQCLFGQISVKPTEILYHGADFSVLEGRCNHPQGHRSIIRSRNAKGEYKTKQLAAYPSQLNQAIADIISRALYASAGS